MNHFQYKGSELYSALKAGVAPRKVVISGVGKDGKIGYIASFL